MMKYLTTISMAALICMISLAPVDMSYADKARGSVSLHFGNGFNLYLGDGRRYGHGHDRGRYRNRYNRFWDDRYYGNGYGYGHNNYYGHNRHNHRPHHSGHDRGRNRACHQSRYTDYYRGRRARMGVTICYDRYGDAYTVPDSRYVIRYLY